MGFVGGFKKFWNWMWESPSIWSWVVLFIFAYIIIQFVFFPVLGMVFSSKLPAVIVESGSMEHGGLKFDDWWTGQENLYSELELNKTQFLQFPLKNGFDKGDIIIVRGLKESEYSIGDTIVFTVSTQKTPIIHRIVSISGSSESDRTFSTKGDHNTGQLDIEKKITANQIVGKAIFVIPKLGWAKLFFVELFRAGL
jgi:hypothetical protein